MFLFVTKITQTWYYLPYSLSLSQQATSQQLHLLHVTLLTPTRPKGILLRKAYYLPASHILPPAKSSSWLLSCCSVAVVQAHFGMCSPGSYSLWASLSVMYHQWDETRHQCASSDCMVMPPLFLWLRGCWDYLSSRSTMYVSLRSRHWLAH